MGLLARIGRALSRAAERITHFREPEPEPREPERDEPDREDRSSELPPGWSLAGLYHEGEKTSRIHATGDTEVTDSEIGQADALIVWYEDAGNDGYRWIHGADDWRSLADQVERVIVIVSPAAE